MPSNKRAAEVESYGEAAGAAGMLENAEDDGWVAPAPMTRGAAEAEDIPSSTEPGQEQAHASNSKAECAPNEDDEEDIPDIDDLELEDHEAEEDEVGQPHAGYVFAVHFPYR